ncbi:hypothetical protein ACWKW6_12720 [Dyadobacter jiangsuensis]
MKKLILLGALILLSVQFSCRTVLRQKSQTDSTAVRWEASSEKWAREIVREYLPGRVDTVHSMTNQVIQVPKVITVQQPVLVRERIRENGEKQQTKSEEKTASTQEKAVTRQGVSPWLYAGAGAGALLVQILFLMLLKAWILAGIPRPGS